MTKEVKREMHVPSKEEFSRYHALVDHGHKLVLVSCSFEGAVEPLAVVLNEADVLWVRNEAGDLLQPVGRLSSLFN